MRERDYAYEMSIAIEKVFKSNIGALENKFNRVQTNDDSHCYVFTIGKKKVWISFDSDIKWNSIETWGGFLSVADHMENIEISVDSLVDMPKKIYNSNKSIIEQFN